MFGGTLRVGHGWKTVCPFLFAHGDMLNECDLRSLLSALASRKGSKDAMD
jgi:hypothetical protein